MPRSLYAQGKSPGYPLDRRLGGPQSRFGRGGAVSKSRDILYILISNVPIFSTGEILKLPVTVAKIY
jgi:hypothetical protein